MSYFILCALIFLATYTLNMTYISLFFHRAWTHRAISLHPKLEALAVNSASWITGIDPKGWVCMHRLHHMHSDTALDPHSPVIGGVLKVAKLQLTSYQKILAGLICDKPTYTSVVKDLSFPVSWVNRTQRWYLPYLLHAFIALVIGAGFDAWLLAACYWLGMMSHPVQGWMVNALGHHYGYRNFETPDQSKNNTMVAWLVFGEGFQNNHHEFPHAAKFSVKWWEVDFGYGLCVILSLLGLIHIPGRKLSETALTGA